MNRNRFQVAAGRNPWAYWAYEFLDTEATHRPRPRWLRRVLPTPGDHTERSPA